MSSTRNTILLLAAFILVMVGWDYAMKQIWPPQPPLPKPKVEPIEVVEQPTQESIGAAVGGLAALSDPFDRLTRLGKVETVEVAKKEKDPEPKVPDIKPFDPNAIKGELVEMGHGDRDFYLQLLLNTQGGAVQQIVLANFPEADREGLEVIQNGKPRLLHLVPGFHRKWTESIREQRKVPYPELRPGTYTRLDSVVQSDPSFVLYHYDKPADDRPMNELGERSWEITERSVDPESKEQKVVFRTTLGEPHHLQITKTFTLKPREYHIGMSIDLKRITDKTGPREFRYQVTGPIGMPIEGEWYTTFYRQAIVGFGDDRGNASRYNQDARELRATGGGDRQIRTDKLAIRYAAVATQYFASAIAVDDKQPNRKFLEFVRATPVGLTHKGKDFLDDLSVRAITENFNPDDVTHKYVLYQGPIKVRLLRQLPKSESVDEALVERYLDGLSLSTMTDYPTNAVSRFFNNFYLTDLIIFFTNVVHSLLYWLSQAIPNLCVCILMVTLIVKIMLFPVSRRQMANAQLMQAKMAKLQPELRKLQEKYGSDFQRMNQERIQLYREHHINPFSALGGCMLFLLQFPIMIGLYCALQESVIFRLDSFLWMPNLAAPDMLIFWTEQIPFVSTPSDLGSTLYLGPYFNILPLIAVGLMIFQQKAMMPPSDDPQVQAQQRMMKFMMILMGLFFYKVAAGLCIYFIAGSVLGLVERRFIPKPATPRDPDEKGPPPKDEPSGPPKPLGWVGRKKQEMRVKWKELLEQAQKQQQHHRDQIEKPRDDAGGKKKKKKRK